MSDNPGRYKPTSVGKGGTPRAHRRPQDQQRSAGGGCPLLMLQVFVVLALLCSGLCMVVR